MRSSHPFAAKIRCGQCGGWFGRKTWHSTSKYARHIWRCYNKYEGDKTGCTTPHVTETQIEEAFVKALTDKLSEASAARNVLEHLDSTAFNTDKQRAELTRLDEQAEGIIARMNALATRGATAAVDPDQYEADYESLEAKYQEIDAKRAQVAAAIKETENQRRNAHQVHEYLQTQPPLAYTHQAWKTLIAEVEVHADGLVTVCFKDEPGS